MRQQKAHMGVDQAGLVQMYGEDGAAAMQASVGEQSCAKKCVRSR